MKVGRFPLLASILLVLAASGVTVAVPETACNDGVDNDGDDFTDGSDPGCTEPYYTDDSEKQVYDLDASWIFSGDNPSTSTGPSIFQPSSVINETKEDTLPDSSTGTSGETREYYIENPREAI